MKLPPEPKIRADVAGLLESMGETNSPGVLEAIVAHVRLLARWNDRFRLTRITSWPQVLDRHLRESLLPLRWIGARGSFVDVGSGNGFPAIPILVCRPTLEGLLVERSERKALFLDAALRETGRTGVRVETHELYTTAQGNERERSPVAETEGRFDFVTSRATMAARRYLELASRLTRPAGRIFMYAGSSAEPVRSELEALEIDLLAREPIPGRKDSFLYVFSRHRTKSSS